MTQLAEAALNPLREGLRLERTPDPCALVIFGATGDLTHRKLVPALYSLAQQRLLPPQFALVGFARRDWSDEKFRDEMRQGVQEFGRGAQGGVWESFASGLFYNRADFANPDGYRRLAELLRRVDQERGTAGNRLYYLATAPENYPQIIRNLVEAGLTHRDENGPWNRIVVEKPFGHDLASAQRLNRQLLTQAFRERQVFRIDHYLGKETVQNILAVRFANLIFEPIWNAQYVDHVQITVAESVGVEGRAGYYDETGATRDMVQNHMMQLLSLVAMEPPTHFEADAVRDEKVKVLRSLQMPDERIANWTVRGQYGPGSIGGAPVPAYRQEPGVAPDSTTETYVALKLQIGNWRWAGTPFYLRTGKRLPKRITEIAVVFKMVPHLLFSRSAAVGLEPNVLALRIQPDEGISLRFGAKVPGPTVRLRSVNMDFLYGIAFGAEPADAYERLLLDAMLGDPTLFTRRDEVEQAWAFITCLTQAWEAVAPLPGPNYPAGSWGPEEAEALIERDGRAWRRL
ncbi:MAG TPA: glucose-6-phosphate dehydrogenase [Chloroflexota bacterium]|jgi:glucose-6-phosphate 1-dehydrogenase|nr:glucose-6-phosphate dehydrogenase [Chloroflexota bacterium]